MGFMPVLPSTQYINFTGINQTFMEVTFGDLYSLAANFVLC